MGKSINNSKVNFSTIISLLAIIISVFFGIKQCNQSQKIQKLTYQVNSIQFQARLELVNLPKPGKMIFNAMIDSNDIPPWSYEDNRIIIDTNRFIISTKNGITEIYPKKSFVQEYHKKFYEYIKNESDTGLVSFKDANLRLPLQLKLVNTGNSLARLLLLSYSDFDTLTGYPILRKRFLSFLNGGDEVVFKGEFFGEYFNNYILPGDTLTTKITFKPRYVNDGKLNLHLIFIYENEIGIISDSYFSVLYDNFPMVLKKERFYNAEKNNYYFHYVIKDDPNQRFKIVEDRKEFKIYSENESNKIKNWLFKETLKKE